MLRSAAIHAALATVYVSSKVIPAEPSDLVCVHSKLDADAIYVDDNTRIQVLDSIPLLGTADKEQCDAFMVSFPISSLWPNGCQSSASA